MSDDECITWAGRLDDFVLSPCFESGRPLAAHTGNQIKAEGSGVGPSPSTHNESRATDG